MWPVAWSKFLKMARGPKSLATPVLDDQLARRQGEVHRPVDDGQHELLHGALYGWPDE